MPPNTQLSARLVPLADFCRDNPQFKIGTMRGFIFRNSRNIRACFVRFGRRLFLDVDKFESWLLAGREGGTDAN